MEKFCTKCNETKLFSFFNKNKTTKDGYQKWCRSCLKVSTDAWAFSNKDKVNAKSKRWKDKNKDKVLADFSEWYNLNKGYYVQWRAANPDKVIAASRAWQKNNPEKVRALNATRRSAKILRTVCWEKELTELVIEEASDLANKRKLITKFEWHVDHVIPLQGSKVSGLHVWNNIAVIPAKENLRKSNKFIVE